MVELENLCRAVRAFKIKAVNMFSPVGTSGLFTINIPLLGHLIENSSWFRSLSALDASPCD